MGCISGIVKYLLFLTNFLVFALGVMMLVFSVMSYIDGSTLSDLVSMGTDTETGDVVLGVFSTAAILIIVISCFVIIVSFFGCCGAIKESKCMLIIYIIIILCTLAAFIAGAVLGVDQDSGVIEKPLLNTLGNYNPGSTAEDDKALVDAWDTIQTEFKCCGVKSLNNWEDDNSYFPTGEGYLVPASCCEERDSVSSDNIKQCQLNPDNEEWTGELPGCLTKLKDVIEDNQDYILYGCIGIILVMILNMVAAFATYCSID